MEIFLFLLPPLLARYFFSLPPEQQKKKKGTQIEIRDDRESPGLLGVLANLQLAIPGLREKPQKERVQGVTAGQISMANRTRWCHCGIIVGWQTSVVLLPQ